MKTFEEAREKAIGEIRGQFNRYVKAFEENRITLDGIHYRIQRLSDAIDYAKTFGLISEGEFDYFTYALICLEDDSFDIFRDLVLRK